VLGSELIYITVMATGELIRTTALFIDKWRNEESQ